MLEEEEAEHFADRRAPCAFLMQFKNTAQDYQSYLVVDLWKRFIPARIAKLQTLDHIIDKPWKAAEGFQNLIHNYSHNNNSKPQ